MKKKIISLFLCLILMIPLGIPLANATQFPDLNSVSDPETFDAIMYASDNGYMKGYPDGKFMPQSYLTRAEFAQLMYNFSGEKLTSFYHPFTDVSKSSWCNTCVGWAYQNKIVNGVSATKFDPNAVLTKEQMITMLYRYATSYLKKAFGTIPDQLTLMADKNSVSSYAKAPISWGIYFGILKPSLFQIKPKENVKRQDAALYLCRFDKNIVGITDKKMLDFSNTSTNFFASSVKEENKTYKISNKLIEQMKNQVAGKYGASSMEYTQIVKRINTQQKKKFTGACVGIAMVTILDMVGAIDFNRFVGDYADFNQVPSGATSNATRDGIFYYQIASSFMPYEKFGTAYKGTEGDGKAAMKALEEEVRKNGGTYFSYRWDETAEDGVVTPHGHALVVTGIEKINDNKYQLNFVEAGSKTNQNFFSIDKNGVTLGRRINGKFKNYKLTAYRFISKKQFQTQIRFLDLDLKYNTSTFSKLKAPQDVELESSVEEKTADFDVQTEKQENFCLENKTWVIVDTLCRITTDVGLTGTIHGSEITGNLPVVNSYQIPYGEDAPLESSVILEGEAPLCICVEQDRDFSFYASNSKWDAMISGNHPVTARCSEAGIVLEAAVPTQIEMVFHDDNHMFTISGTADGTVTLSKRGEGYEIRGMTGEGSVSCENTDSYTVEFSNNYPGTGSRDLCFTKADGRIVIRNLEEDTQ